MKKTSNPSKKQRCNSLQKRSDKMPRSAASICSANSGSQELAVLGSLLENSVKGGQRDSDDNDDKH
ncbi:hypothetical protein [Chlorobium phaeobacteroides]|uniref:hypothetical protein n=1 Tax=Chlorobium phaeobacteroides TaxID=1096 RepID=UPI000300963C|nr:hypothetical protein [Chlorobium phaeobacteroides]